MNYDIESFNDQIYSSYGRTNEKEARFLLHLHNHFEINLFIEGEMTFYIQGEFYKPIKGDLFLISNTQLHGPSILKESVYERAIIHFPQKMARQLQTPEVDLLYPFTDLSHENNRIIHLTDTEITEFISLTKRLVELEQPENKVYGKEILFKSYLAQILVLVNNAYNNNHKKELTEHSKTMSELSLNVIEYIQENLEISVSLDDIEAHLNINKHYMNRVFKQELGTSIYQFIQLNKISLAKKLLESGMSAFDVCDHLDYNNYSTFARTFKKITGISPTHYIKSVL